MNILIALIIGISLSMDAFSLALSIGFFLKSKLKRLLLSSIVGVFHFFMPILGHLLGSKFIELVPVDTHLLSSIIFFYICIQMFKEYRNEEESNYTFSIIGMLIFAIGVSLDSFGIGFTLTNNEIILNAIIYSLMSFTFTLTGLTLSQKLNLVFGNYATIVGILLMLTISLINFAHFVTF